MAAASQTDTEMDAVEMTEGEEPISINIDIPEGVTEAATADRVL